MKKAPKWRWFFGSGYEFTQTPSDLMTEAEAKRYMKMKGFGWMEKVDDTMVKEES